jgi:hypothetical protein
VEQQCGVATDGPKLEALVLRTSPLGHWLNTLLGRVHDLLPVP